MQSRTLWSADALVPTWGFGGRLSALFDERHTGSELAKGNRYYV